MKNKMLLLIKTNFMMLLAGNRTNTGKSKIKRIPVYLLFAFLVIYLGGFSVLMTFSFHGALDSIGLKSLVPCLYFIIASTLTLFTGLFASQGFLFKAKDIEMLFALPVSHGDILASKFAVLYFYEFLYSFLTIGLSSVVLMIIDKFTVMSLVTSIVAVFLAPILPMSVGCLLAFVFGLALRKVKNQNALTTIVTTCLSLGLIVIIYSSDFSKVLDYFLVNGSRVFDGIRKYYYPAAAYVAAYEGDILYLLLFIAINVIPLAVIILLMKGKYSVLVATMKRSLVKADYSYARSGASKKSVLFSCFKKEFKRVVSSSTYLLNCASGALLLIMFCFTMPGISGGLSASAPQEGLFAASFLPWIVMMLFIFAFSLTSTTSCTMSLESKTLWIYKSSPIDTKTVFRAKAMVNMGLNFPLIIVFSSVYALMLSLAPISWLLIMLVGGASVTAASYIGLVMNLLLPKMDWTNETQVIKQSASVFATMGVATGICIFTGVGSFFLLGVINIPLIMLIAFALYLIVTFVFRRIALSYGVKKYELL